MLNKLKTLFKAPPKEELLAIFKEHYEAECSFVRASIYWMVRSQSVDDIVQETFAKAWAAFESFKGDADFKTWIYRIAMNTTYDYLKKENRYAGEILVEEGKEDGSEIKDLVSKALFDIPKKHREVFILFYKFEYKVGEISSLMGISQGTVKSRLFRGRDLFQAYIKKNGENYE